MKNIRMAASELVWDNVPGGTIASDELYEKIRIPVLGEVITIRIVVSADLTWYGTGRQF